MKDMRATTVSCAGQVIKALKIISENILLSNKPSKHLSVITKSADIK